MLTTLIKLAFPVCSFWGPIIGAVGGALVGGLFSQKGQQDANAANSAQSAAQMEFQERMANTAHQREVADLRAAGLNPVLSGTGGMGSVTPAGAQAVMQNEDAGLAQGIGQAVGSGLAAKRTREEIDNIEADTDLKRADRNLRSVDWNVRKNDEELRIEQKHTQSELTRKAKAEADIATATAKGAKLEGEIDETDYGETMRYIDRAVRSVTGGAGVFRGIGSAKQAR